MPPRNANKDWLIEEPAPPPSRTDALGSKLLIANGYLGYRGTLEEHGPGQRVACTLAGVYDRRGGAWREPVNAPNGLLLRLYDGPTLLSPETRKPRSHRQSLDIRHGVHTRETVFPLVRGGRLTLRIERFASLAEPHQLHLRAVLAADHDCTLMLEAGIDAEVWDINGPHFAGVKSGHAGGLLHVSARTNEGKMVHVVEGLAGLPVAARLEAGPQGALRRARLRLKGGQALVLEKTVCVYTSQDPAGGRLATARDACRRAQARGQAAARAAHARAWDARWADSDVQISGDPAGQRALRYSIYQLLSIAPRSGRASIPARGLSGQVYKGAVFWDTEMFMLPFFNATQPVLARDLVRYRIRTLGGAKRKARSLGYRGAFYAWESQESGDEACTLFNITDVLTGRPLRTYFADKQVHISADVAHALWDYCQQSGDQDLLARGGAEVLAEVARFFLSYCRYNPDRRRYEVLDVTGPDEYHERVHNNAFSAGMARRAVGAALEALAWLKRVRPQAYRRLDARLGLARDLPALRDLHARLYVPEPHPRTGVIEQFSGYHRLEDARPGDLKARLLDPREYLGGGQGLATTTQVIKQADVLALLHFQGGLYSTAVKRANWEFYEPRTEHGSSLSACIYALVAAAIGRGGWAYRYFLKTATVDLRGDAKQTVGSLYIGGTHPAANGGAWMAAVQGFGGLGHDGQGLVLAPALPAAWRSLRYRAAWRGQWVTVHASPRRLVVEADPANAGHCPVRVRGLRRALSAGQRWTLPIRGPLQGPPKRAASKERP